MMLTGHYGKPVGSPDAPGSGEAIHHKRVRVVGYILSAVFAAALIAFIVWLM